MKLTLTQTVTVHRVCTSNPGKRRLTDLAEFVVGGGAGVHEGLRDGREARVDDVRLVDVEHELRVLDQVHPEPQRQTATTKQFWFSRPFLTGDCNIVVALQHEHDFAATMTLQNLTSCPTKSLLIRPYPRLHCL